MRNILKRAISCFVCLAVVLVSFPVSIQSVAAESYPPDTAVIKLNAVEAGGKGFATVECGTKNQPTVVERAGQKCWLFDKNNAETHSVGVVLAEDFKHNEFDGTEYDIEIDYYDVQKGYFILHYDERINMFDQYGGITLTDGESIWKTAKYTLQGADFKKRVDGKYDFKICITEKYSQLQKVSESIPIKEIRVVKREKKNPIYVTTETRQPANIYKWFEESKVLYNTFENFTDTAKNVTVEHTLKDETGLVVFSKSEEMSFGAKEKKEHQLEFGEVTRCGIFSYEVKIKSADGSVNSSIKSMELAVIKSDPNGIRNDRVYWMAPLNKAVERRAEVADINDAYERTDLAIEVIKLSNANGVRASIGWEHMDKNGVFDWENSINGYYFKRMREEGMKLMAICMGGHHTITSGLRNFARTEEQISRYEDFLEWIAGEVGDIVDVWETFNEPNIEPFNAHVNDWANGSHVMMVGDRMAAAIKRGDPDCLVYGPCVCSMMTEHSQKFFKDVVDTGLLDKNLDGFSFHPYISRDPETYRSYDGETVEDMIYNHYIKVIEDAGIEDFRYFDSEVGYSSGEGPVDDRIDAAQKLQRYLLYMDAREMVDGHVIHCLTTQSDILYGREDQYGACNGWEDGKRRWGAYVTPMTSFLVMTAYNYLMMDFSVEKCMDDPEKNIWMTKYNSHKFNKDILTLSSLGDPKLVTLKLDTDKVTVFDWVGNETEVYGKDGVFTFNSGDRALYIMGDIGEVEVLEEKPLFATAETVLNVAVNDMKEIKIANNSGIACQYEVMAPETVKVLSNEEKNGEAVIHISNGAELDSEYQVTVDAVAPDGKRIASICFTVNSTPSAIANISFSRADSDDINQWKGTLRVKNTSMNNALKGKISFSSPSDLAAMKPVDIGVVTASREGEIEIKFPPIKKKGRQFAIYDIVLESGEVVSGSQEYETAMALYAHKKPTIDGVLEKGEWNMDGAMYADTAEQVVNILDWGGTDDLSGRSVVEWDEENFYLMVEVTDNIFSQTYSIADSWNGDSIQFGISAFDTGYVPIGEEGTTFHEIALAMCPGETRAYRFMSQEGSDYEKGIVEAATLAVKRNGNKAVYELVIPWDKLINPGQTLKEGDEIKYSFLINDNDGAGRRGWIECGSGIGSGKDMRLFMTMTLEK